MKRIFLFTLLISTFLSFSQSSSKSNFFIGDWVWKNNNKLFKVHIYTEFNMIKGDYTLYDKRSGNTIVLYKSNKLVNKLFDYYFGPAIVGSVKSNSEFSAAIKDNVLFGDGIHGVREGELIFKILSNNKAKWQVKYLKTNDKKKYLEPYNFIIPTDIILTKVK